MHKLTKILGSGAILSVIPAIAWGQDAPTLESLAANDAFVFNTLLFLIGGFLVMWMAAGFAMLKLGWFAQKMYPCSVLKTSASILQLD